MTAPKPVDPVDWGTIERLEDVLSDHLGGALIDPHRQSDPAFKGDQARQRHFDAMAADLKHPCPEDRLR